MFFRDFVKKNILQIKKGGPKVILKKSFTLVKIFLTLPMYFLLL